MAGDVEKKRTFPCKQCGGDAQFTPAIGLQCPFCGFQQPIPQSAEEVHEFSFDEYLRSGKRPVGAAMEGKDVQCKGCGAATRVAADVASMNCAFCGNAMVLEPVALPPQLLPEGIVPFTVDKNRCQELFKDWIRKRWFAPNALKNLAATDKIVALYRPYWTFDADTDSWYSGERGDAYYETEHYTDAQGRRQSRQVRKIRWSRVSGRVNHFFDDVLVFGGRPTEWQTNYDLSKLQRYDAAYLAGWAAERYTIPPEEAWTSARKIMDGDIYGRVKRDIGGDEQRVHSVKTSYNALSFKHVLLPLYLSAYRFGGKPYRFQVNGQSGEVRGQRPYSFWKIFSFIVLILGIVAGIVLLSRALGGKHSSLEPYPDRQIESAQREVDIETVGDDVLDAQVDHLVADAHEDLFDRSHGDFSDGLEVSPFEVAVPSRQSDQLRLDPQPARELADEPRSENGQDALDLVLLGPIQRLGPDPREDVEILHA